MTSPTIFSYIKSEENKFETEEITLGDNWSWNLRNHVQMIFHLKNGVFYTGENNWLRAFKNIMEPIINLTLWTEDIELKDVTFFIENDDGKVLSFLVKKYHDEVYVKENDLDLLFDELTESDVEFGGTLLQKGSKTPEVISLMSLAFCDQTDMLGGPLGIKFYFSPDKLRGMSSYGWGDEKNGATISLDELCLLASNQKDSASLSNDKNEVSGKAIEVYVVRGNLPENYLKDNDNMEDYYNQIEVVAFYVTKEGKEEGVVLYRKKEEEGNLKFFTSKKVYQRALGRGVGETLIHPQIWTNFLTIHKTNLLESASKVPLQTDDQNFTNRNKIQDMENLEVAVVEEGKTISRIDTAAVANIQLYSAEINEWWGFAQSAGSADDPLMGKEATSGTTFRGQERTVAQGQGLHNKRRGQRAKFIEEVYRDWIIPDIKKEILKGKKFLASLTNEELNWIAERLANVEANQIIKDAILYHGKYVTKEQQDALIEVRKQANLKKGNRQLVEILEKEFEDVEIKMGINVASKQKDLAQLSDKLLSIFQFIFSNPAGFQQAMQIPALSKSFENILEFGGMSIGDFSTLLNVPPAAQQPMQQPVQGQQPQLLANNQA